MNSTQTVGILWMLVFCLAICIMSVFARLLTTDFSALQINFLRAISALPFFIPWLLKHRPPLLQKQHLPVLLFRTCLSYIGLALFYTALAHIPIAVATSITFMSPIIASIIGIVIFKEASDGKRWLALGLGFIGMLVVLRPGTEAFNAYSLCAVASAIIWATVNSILKMMTKKLNPVFIAFYSLLLTIPVTLPGALWSWHNPTLEHLPLCLGLGMSVAVAQISLGNAVANADMTLLTPYDFTRIIFIAIIGYVVFDEIIDTWTLIGTAFIMISTLYATYHVVKNAKKTARNTL